jgi:GDP-L-fucose synthase
MDKLSDKSILVTGGAGFLGNAVVKRLHGIGCHNIFIPRSKMYDLTNQNVVQDLFKNNHFDVVIHLAAKVGGIGANMKNPGTFFYDNLSMGILLMETARISKIDKFVAIGTICAYPKNTPIPFKEENLWNGYPEETNAPYGLAKKMLLVQAQAYRQQYGLNAIYLLPVNLYGPGDNFDPEYSHVIPALIKKCIDARESNIQEIIVWGDGSATREFLYVEDAAEAIVLATKKYNKSDPVNIGSGMEISIKDLALLIALLTKYNGNIKWDISKPNGQPRRCLDISRAFKEFDFQAKTDFVTGLKTTISWYEKERKNIEVTTNDK